MHLRKIKTHHKHSQGIIFSWVVLFLSIGIGIFLPILPNFIKSIVKTNEAVSIFYSVMAIAMFFAAIGSTIFFKRIKRTTITKISFIFLAISFFLLIFVTEIHELAILKIAKVIFSLFLTMALALFVRDFAKEKDLGHEEGVYYTFYNIGLIIGPLIGGFIGAYLNYEIAFIIATIITLIGLQYFHKKHVIDKHVAILKAEKKSKHEIFDNITTYFRSKARIKAYFITMVQMLWMGFKTLYIPLYVVMSGYIESLTGIILAVSIIPFIFLEGRIGAYADKKGIRIPISAGFLIIAISLFVIFVNSYHFVNFIILILGSVGAALVEPLQEYYLFKRMPKEEEDSLYGVYMTADPIAYFLTPGIGALVLAFLPFNYLFLVFGILILAASVVCYFTLPHSSLDKPLPK